MTMFDYPALTEALGTMTRARYAVMGRDAFAAYHDYQGPTRPLGKLPIIAIYNRDVPPPEVKVYDSAWALLATLEVGD